MVRTYLDSDAEALADFDNAQLAVVGIPPRTTPDEVRWWFSGGLIRDAATDSRLVLDDDGALIAFGTVSTPPTDGYRVFLAGGVDPAHRGRGLGREMFEWQLTRAGEIHAAAGAADKWVIESSGDLRDADRLALYARYGLAPARWWFHMEMDPADVGPAALPEGITAAPYRDSDAKALHATAEEAFIGHYGSETHSFEEWADLMVRGDDAFRPGLSLIARDGDEVVAFTLGYASVGDSLWIGEVGTRARWRRRGIAGALLAEMLRRAAAAGMTNAYLDVDSDNAHGASRVYEGLGFRTTDRWVTVNRPF
jgi:ribosomal protein S18 acetylase RimI-like enzyme